MVQQSELDRIRIEYTRRSKDTNLAKLYTPFHPGHLFTIQNRERTLLKILKYNGFYDLSRLKIVDIGSGQGHFLLSLLQYGAMPNNLVGIDLMSDWLLQSQEIIPNSLHVQANAGELPFPDQAFNLVFMFTVLTSILDPHLKQAIAAQARRIVASGGLIIIYDFKSSARNPHIQGVSPAEIRSLFPGMKIEFQALTLAMGIAWRLAPYSWFLCTLLEPIPWLKTHYLATIHP